MVPIQIDEEHTFGRGAVNADGIPAKGDAATGISEWIMTKVREGIGYLNSGPQIYTLSVALLAIQCLRARPHGISLSVRYTLNGLETERSSLH